MRLTLTFPPTPTIVIPAEAGIHESYREARTKMMIVRKARFVPLAFPDQIENDPVRERT